MSYHRKKGGLGDVYIQHPHGGGRIVKRALAGVQSRAPGTPVYRGALGNVQSQAPGAPVYRNALSGTQAPSWYRAMSGAPDWYRQMQGLGSLGDDSLSVADLEAKWKADMLAGQQKLIDAQKTWAEGDHFQKWVQIGVTASIPIFAALWRALGVGRRR